MAAEPFSEYLDGTRFLVEKTVWRMTVDKDLGLPELRDSTPLVVPFGIGAFFRGFGLDRAGLRAFELPPLGGPVKQKPALLGSNRWRDSRVRWRGIPRPRGTSVPRVFRPLCWCGYPEPSAMPQKIHFIFPALGADLIVRKRQGESQ